MTKRLTGALAVGLVVCTAMAMPAAANAHNDQPCSNATWNSAGCD